ncbi:leucyl aminopeptidase [Qipengyuania sp. 1NDW9]|uniref:Probable cytosol aminopeptidase n=1 Tax=Qipengyuania aquimaris TaxID=255984 RepID=A0A9Q3RZF1_9SPHN|nr:MULTISPECIES: leucyl aminopeptidase [Qipengyuania]MBX7493617.1 leucyl aminopeptidase [Qipengyuania xiapuensis]MBY6129241.1 leucyl aminopeptidase [Qipengyuania aquimaris]MBY6217217.1 leucyl aminopeptidase [Qipengyuania aquimaris]
MHIQFSQSRPQGARLIAHVVDKGKLPDSLNAAMRAGAEAARFKGNAGQTFDGFAETGDGVARLALAGAGDRNDEGRLANLEKAGAALAGKYQSTGDKEVVLDLTDSSLDANEAAHVLLGLRLRNWRYDVYRTKLKDEQKITLEGVTVVGAPEGTEAAWQDHLALAEGVEFTRELVTEPANIIYPESFVERCKERFEGTGAELVVLDEAQMEELGMGSLLGVGQGSVRESRILAIRWNGGGSEAPVAFVGKGVTFDTGGISIKPGPGMEDMKWDMGGAGAVAGGMLALVKRKAKANVVGVMGLVENMPDGNAQRPGDVVKSMNGQTIEILNTDAEGRLVLADALHWTQEEYQPSRIVDFATLTGAIIISLGHEYAGLFSNDDELSKDLSEAGEAVGDKVWRMPLGKAYDKLIDSPIADMKNIGGKGAGSITAAQFLQRFIADDTPWAHIDIAGMAWSDKPGRTWGKGATGYGVRLIDRLIADTVES